MLQILKEYASAKLNIKNSQFLAELFPLESQVQARIILKEQKKKYQDATHVVHAFVIGSSGEILGCSDDGEPSGTAGHPALAVLKGSCITGVMLTITRWFGGTLLGTGGLVKAYTESAKAVLLTAKTECLIEKYNFEIICQYPNYEFIKIHFGDLAIDVKSIDFTEVVTIRGSIPVENKNALCEFIKNACNGSQKIKLSFSTN